MEIRAVHAGDYEQWRVLWDAYNAFYDRSGPTALPEAITHRTWERLLDSQVPLYCLVAVREGRLVGMSHYLTHLNTTLNGCICYLQDLYVDASLRGGGVRRALILATSEAAHALGAERLYWQTKSDNHAPRALYDKVAEHAGFIVYRRAC